MGGCDGVQKSEQSHAVKDTFYYLVARQIGGARVSDGMEKLYRSRLRGDSLGQFLQNH